MRTARVPLLYPRRYAREKLSVHESDRRCSPLAFCPGRISVGRAHHHLKSMYSIRPLRFSGGLGCFGGLFTAVSGRVRLGVGCSVIAGQKTFPTAVSGGIKVRASTQRDPYDNPSPL